MLRHPFLLACLVAACQPIPGPVPPSPDADSSVPPPPPPLDIPDASVDPVAEAAAPSDVRADLVLSGTQCAQFCAVLDWLGCPEGRPTPKGEPCSDVCDAVTGFPGLKLPTAATIKCRDIACVRKAGVRCR